MRLNRHHRTPAPTPTDPTSTDPAPPRSIPGGSTPDEAAPGLLALRVQLVLTLAVAALVGSATVGHAETVQVLAIAKSVTEVLDNIRNWIVSILVALAIVFATIGGVKWIMASEPGDAEKAKSAFKNAGIGFVLAVLAPLLVEVLQSVIGGP